MDSYDDGLCIHSKPRGSGCQQYPCGDSTAPLTPEAVRTLLRECVTVIKPGETLIVRVPWATPARTVYELGRVLHEQAEMAGAAFHTLVVPAAEIGAGKGPQETVHACPPDGGGPMPCCGRTPFEASRWHRMTMEPGLVTCGGKDG